MKIFVTGGCGFIDYDFIRYGIGDCSDWQKVNLGKLTLAGNLKNLEDIQGFNHKSIRVDIADKMPLENLLAQEEFDSVKNSAFETREFRRVLDSLPFVEMHYMERESITEWFMGNICSFCVKREGHGK